MKFYVITFTDGHVSMGYFSNARNADSYADSECPNGEDYTVEEYDSQCDYLQLQQTTKNKKRAIGGGR